MNRKQLYNEITSLNLQAEVKAKFGENYTRVSNANLQTIVDEAHAAMDCVTHKSVKALDKLVEILAKKKILLKSEVNAIMNI